MGAGTELVDVVDDQDRVIDTVPRSEIRARNLLHRSVFIVVVTSDGAVVAHQRADWKDVWPSRWDIGFGGVVAAGESYLEAGVRELAEEAGVVVAPGQLERLTRGRYSDERVRELSVVYGVVSDGPFTFPDGEVAASEIVPGRDLRAWVDSRDMVLDSVALVLPHVERYLDRVSGS
jgi:8-oxo-dGTP pyrophosphatase MutT (NUDIX family)